MALKLNATREACREFYGQNVEQMLKLIADGRTPMNTAQLIQRRLDVRNSDDVKALIWIIILIQAMLLSTILMEE